MSAQREPERVEHFDPKQRCAQQNCHHWFQSHREPRRAEDTGVCTDCDFFDREHDFIPYRLAGGAYTAQGEREAYERAMRGE